jgi:hypothetical protein
MTFSAINILFDPDPKSLNQYARPKKFSKFIAILGTILILLDFRVAWKSEDSCKKVYFNLTLFS